LAETTTTDILKIGDKAPDFTLSAANRASTFSLSELLQRGPAIVEFLRGTW
jgi:peroxiredoxin